MTSKKEQKNKNAKRRGASQWAVAWRRFKRNRAAVVGLAIVLVVVFLAVFGRFFAPYPSRPDPGAFEPFYKGDVRVPPNSEYWFGTSGLGTDILSEVIHGAKYSLYVGVIVTVITIGIAILVGSTAGYFGGWVDNVLMRFTEVFLVFPALLFIQLPKLYCIRPP